MPSTPTDQAKALNAAIELKDLCDKLAAAEERAETFHRQRNEQRNRAVDAEQRNFELQGRIVRLQEAAIASGALVGECDGCQCASHIAVRHALDALQPGDLPPEVK